MPPKRMRGESASPRRSLAGRPADTTGKLIDAAVDALRDVGYDRLSMRDICRRAGVTHATAYGYFASKQHLVSEAFHRSLVEWSTRPIFGDTAGERLAYTFAGLGQFMAEDPSLNTAAMAAMLADDADVHRLRGSAGDLIGRKLVDALGDRANPAALDALNMAVSGAMLQAGMGFTSYEAMVQRLKRMGELVLAETSAG
ncbi:TetR/AcrR family transcriptional regulator [Rhodococcus gannanensis]|uniref:TetR/AcrR family transcriptional regulator n=1 Tax=Rhodococcus gannanensis TaxID=1960308 RepID=A0ABW4P532_9NOCA